MASKARNTREQENIARMKEDVVAYYSKLPILKYAAMSVARDEDTVIRWRNDDAEFADRLQKAKASFLLSKVNKVRAEFYLERQFREEFGNSLDITSGGDKVQPVLVRFVGEDAQDGGTQGN